MKKRIDLNCDMGEGMENEQQLMPYISSANIACGFHAGDEATMRRVTRLCIQYGVSVGAHPSFPDRQNFGRVNMDLPADRLKEIIETQIRVLKQICLEEGTVLRHIKPHGALYNMAAADRDLAGVICSAVRDIDSGLILYGLSGSQMAAEAKAQGLKFYHEVFADRTYRRDGTLTPRSMPGALIINPERAADQALRLAKGTGIMAEGKEIFPEADTICLHGDGPDAVAFAISISELFQKNQTEISHE